MSPELVSKTTAPVNSEQQSKEGGATMRPPAFQLKASGGNPIQRAEDECSTEEFISPGNERYAELISNAKPDAPTALKIIGLASRGKVMIDLMRNGKYDVVKAVYANASWSDTDNLTCETLQSATYTDLLDAPNEVLQTFYDSLNGGLVFADELIWMQTLKTAMEVKAILPTKEETCEQEAETTEKFDPATLKPAADYVSGSGASTLYGKSQTDVLGAILKSEKTKGSVSFVNNNKTTFQADDDYYKAVDARYTKRNEVEKDKITDNQKGLLEIARRAARSSDYFDQVVNSNDAGKAAEIDFSKAQLSNDAFTFSSVLKKRMLNYHKFMVAVGLYTISKPQPGGQSALRDRPVAHKWSTEHYITQNKNKDLTMNNFVTMFNDTNYQDGDKIVDKDKSPWAKKAHFVDKDAKQLGTEGAGEIDKDKTWDNIKAYVNTFNYRGNKSSLASEGYEKSDTKRFPNTHLVGISNHISGNALDLTKQGFLNMDDQINDFIAWEFGVQRNVGGEQWHFECTGRPAQSEETGETQG
ncbi:MAG: hypothetical protein RLZZ519_16 [Bacteroidota bacterium]|jgi:hypothetical protein